MFIKEFNIIQYYYHRATYWIVVYILNAFGEGDEPLTRIITPNLMIKSVLLAPICCSSSQVLPNIWQKIFLPLQSYNKHYRFKGDEPRRRRLRKGGAGAHARCAQASLMVISLFAGGTKGKGRYSLMRGDTDERQRAEVSKRGTVPVLRTSPSIRCLALLNWVGNTWALGLT